jgi:NTE family protein
MPDGARLAPRTTPHAAAAADPSAVRASIAGGRPRIGVVLSAGGLRGVAHLGVMRRLVAERVPIDVIVGVSAGAVIAAYYAAVGLTIDEMIADAPAFQGRHLVMHGMTLRVPVRLRPWMQRFCGIIPKRLEQLETARFDRLHHGVAALGIVCHDLIAHRPVYFSSLDPHGEPLPAVVKSSAALPGIIPTRRTIRHGRVVHLIDGGLSDSLPCDFAGAGGLGATHLIVSDCRRVVRSIPTGRHVTYIRPELKGATTLRSPSGTLLASVRRGEEACTPDVLASIRRWMEPEPQIVTG